MLTDWKAGWKDGVKALKSIVLHYVDDPDTHSDEWLAMQLSDRGTWKDRLTAGMNEQRAGIIKACVLIFVQMAETGLLVRRTTVGDTGSLAFAVQISCCRVTVAKSLMLRTPKIKTVPLAWLVRACGSRRTSS